VKFLQVVGSLIPFFLIAFSYYLFADLEPGTPSYAGSALAMLLSSATLLSLCFIFLFVLPSSFILLDKVNRDYFAFNSKGWLLILAINWLFILLYTVGVAIFMVSSFR
jgi:hypothetical protein